ncbi:MAG TPA: histidine phosphatase family protein [Steroidobacteraceae bacterium]
MDSMLLGRTVDPPLDLRGESQAQALAEHFSSLAQLWLEASPRRRAQQTAAAIALRRGGEVRTAVEMDEVDFGHWSGRSFALLAEDPRWREWNERRSQSQTPAGEKISMVQRRAMEHLRSLGRTHAEETIAIVTHAEIIRSVVLACLGASIDNYSQVEIAPASLTTLSMNGAQLRLDRYNERIVA